MKKNILLTATVFATILFASCNKSSTSVSPNSTNNGSTGNNGNNGNNGALAAGMNYELVAINTLANVAQKGTQNATITWTTAVATPTQIKFEAKQNGAEVEFKSANSAQINLLSSVATNFGNFTLPNGSYDEVELRISLNKVGNSPAMQLAGTFSNGTVTTPVTFQIDNSIELRTETDSVTITSNTAFQSVTTLDLATFTNGITQTMLQNATLTNGTLIISQSSNVNLYNIIVGNLSNRHHNEINHH